MGSERPRRADDRPVSRGPLEARDNEMVVVTRRTGTFRFHVGDKVIAVEIAAGEETVLPSDYTPTSGQVRVTDSERGYLPRVSG